MKWLVLLVLVIGSVFAWKALTKPSVPTADTPIGAAKIFIRAALDNNVARINEVTVPGAQAQAAQVAEQLRGLLESDTLLPWQKVESNSGKHAVQATISGKGRVLVLEFTKEGEMYRITTVGLAEM